jgi:hypothetical protein
MAAFRLFLDTTELISRMQQRLGGSSGVQSPAVVWSRSGDSVLVFHESLQARALNGWLVCALDLQSDETGRQNLQFVFYMGTETEGNGPLASVSVNAPSPAAAQLADRWGVDLQRVLWDAVLDGIEAAVSTVAIQIGPAGLHVAGFHCTRDALLVDVLATVNN